MPTLPTAFFSTLLVKKKIISSTFGSPYQRRKTKRERGRKHAGAILW
jgi:hypothetical protein